MFASLGISAYGLCVALAALAGLAAFGFAAKREGCPRASLRVFAPLAIALGFLGARLYHILAYGVVSGMLNFNIFSPYPFQYAMCGAVVGVIAACAIAAKIVKAPFAYLADALAPAGMAAIAAARCGEVFSDFGWGLVMNGGPQFFPFAVQDMYGQWHGAVFFMEALCAMAALFYALRMKPERPGECFALTLTFWAMTQVFCESFRAETLRWGFVRVQQIQCAVFALVVLAVYSRKVKPVKLGRKDPAVLLCWVVFIECVAAVVLMEYAIDKWTLPVALDYAIMALALYGVFACVRCVVRRAARQEAQA